MSTLIVLRFRPRDVMIMDAASQKLQIDRTHWILSACEARAKRVLEQREPHTLIYEELPAGTWRALSLRVPDDKWLLFQRASFSEKFTPRTWMRSAVVTTIRTAQRRQGTNT